jgi:hypothetical protein
LILVGQNQTTTTSKEETLCKVCTKGIKFHKDRRMYKARGYPYNIDL